MGENGYSVGRWAGWLVWGDDGEQWLLGGSVGGLAGWGRRRRNSMGKNGYSVGRWAGWLVGGDDAEIPQSRDESFINIELYHYLPISPPRFLT